MRWMMMGLLLVLPLSAFAGDLVLENARMKVVFNKKTGALEQLIRKRDGWVIQKRPELGRAFRMDMPLPNQRFNPVYGKDQRGPAVSVDPERKRIRFTWKRLRSRNGGLLEIDFTGIVEMTGDGLVFTAEIDNRSPYTVETVYWPILADLTRPHPDGLFRQLGMEYGGMRELQLFPKFDNQPGYFAVDYPTQMLQTPDTPFSLIDAVDRGLYVGYHDTTASQLVQFMARLKPGYIGYEFWDTGVNPRADTLQGKPVQLEFAVVHFPFVGPRQKGRLLPVVLQPYQGSWHRGADLYKQWRNTWFHAPAMPAWLRQVHAWQQIHLNNPESDIRYRYRDLIDIGRDCAWHGVEAIQVTGWTLGGQDSDNPSHDTDPHLGTRDDLAEAIREIQKMGVKVILFNKFTWADRTTAWYRNELIRYATKDPYGEPHYYSGYAYQTATQLADINTHRFSPLCPLSAEWRRIAGQEFVKSILLGADGMLYDENQHHGGARYCFDASHGHAVPSHIYAGDALLAGEFHRIAAQQKPDYVFAGEGNYDLQFRQYHLSYFRVDLHHVALHRYVAPQQEMIIAVSGYNDRNMINLALMNRYIISYEPRNFKGRLDEFPLTIDYGKKVDALRRQFSDYLWRGTFQDTLGAEVRHNGARYAHYSVFVHLQNQKRAVVVVNYSYEADIEVAVRLPRGSSKLVVVTPEAPSPVAFTGSLTLPANSAAVVLEK